MAQPELYEPLARVGKALASPVRLRILDALIQGPRTVEKLAAATNQTIANVSQHLQVLRAAGLLSSRKRGLFVTYCLADDAVAQFFVALRRLGEQQLPDLAELRRQLDSGEMERVDRRELLARVRSGRAVVIDVRPREEYDAAHLPHAISIPLTELQRRLGELPRRKQIVAYCRGPYCLMSSDAVRLLRKRGYRAERLQEGVAEWSAAGLPLALPEDSCHSS